MGRRLIHISEEDTEVVYVSKRNRVLSGSTSKGNQRKWMKDGKFIKLNTWKWYEDISEVLVSYLLGFSSVGYYVEYFPCVVVEDGVKQGKGCYSYSFLKDGESNISLYRILKNSGISMQDANYDCV